MDKSCACEKTSDGQKMSGIWQYFSVCATDNSKEACTCTETTFPHFHID